MNKNNYTVAVNLEDIESGLISLHQASFFAYNHHEAIGRAVEKFMGHGDCIHSYKVNQNASVNENVSEYIDLLERGRKIEAIKLRRNNTGDGLKEAKEFIEQLPGYFQS